MTGAIAPSSVTPLTDLTSVPRADVHKNGHLAAHLTRTRDGVTFAYTDAWIANAGPPIASTLPTRAAPVSLPGGAVPAYFAGLLPEGRRLLALQGGVKTSADDELSLLLAVGDNTVGDVSVLPEGAPLNQTSAYASGADLATISFTELVADLDTAIDRVGVPGVQDKISASMINLPMKSTSGHVLLKLSPTGIRHLVENEAFFLDAAKRSGLRVVTNHVVSDRDGVTGLVVDRFDRNLHGGRLAVEDGCQALGLHPASKYLVSAEEVLRALCSLCESPLAAAREFLRMLAFAYLTGNGDAHAKNFSVVQDASGRWQPAPAYDLPNTTLYGDHLTALAVAGKKDTSLTGLDFVELGKRLGVPATATTKAVTAVATKADLWLDDLDSLPFTEQELHKLGKALRLRRTRLLAF